MSITTTIKAIAQTVTPCHAPWSVTLAQMMEEKEKQTLLVIGHLLLQQQEEQQQQ